MPWTARPAAPRLPPRAERRAVHRGDDGHLNLLPHPAAAQSPVRGGFCEVAREQSVLNLFCGRRQGGHPIEASTEGLALAAEHDGSDAAVEAELETGGEQTFEHREDEPFALVGAVQTHVGDVIAGAELDASFGHGPNRAHALHRALARPSQEGEHRRMMVMFQVFVAPGADPDTLLTPDTIRDTNAQIMTLDGAQGGLQWPPRPRGQGRAPHCGGQARRDVDRPRAGDERRGGPVQRLRHRLSADP